MSTTHTNPQDSLKSTWLLGDKSQWRWQHKLLASRLDPTLEMDVPVHAKTAPIPYLVGWPPHAFVLLTALGAMGAHQLILYATGWRALPGSLVFGLYSTAALHMLGRLTTALRRLGKRHGYLDGAHPRAPVPDAAVNRILLSLVKLMLGRPGLTVLLAYRPSTAPVDVMARPVWWAWLFAHVGAYTLTLDFFFYWYHRAMHDVPALWAAHRTHHIIKHPTSMLAAYADHVQEMGDLVVMPLLTYAAMRVAFGDRFDFYHWWVCQTYVMFTEPFGHSGLRVLGSPPSTFGWLWDRLGVSIVIEDHDIHHRRGSKKSFNYGKQTLVWDHIFGTVLRREESQNVDWSNKVYFPMS
ncbi:Fatty acid hydroxylase [Cordyceps militaris]|uniref:Fatty acid hydroxylase n=1 Tax=Cordyceps militaris TaxID=73501 RepID=A0A2H4SRB8_CORMI|nr:Fatty acid hydroxylase [Cordyceps militaris]